MFSNSPTYLGSGNSTRPGASQYGQPSAFPGQQQSFGMAPQPTGFNSGPLQQQFTGYPSQGQTSQNVQPPQQQALQSGPPQQPQQMPFGQSSQQQFQSPQSAPQASVPLRTGQTSSQIAQSFTSGPGQLPTPTLPASGTRIPKIRLSFLTATDQAKFEQLFKSAVGDAQALDGEKCKDLLLRSNLPGSELMRIWTLSDTTKSGQLLFPEFALAMYLCNIKLVGKELPQALPEKIANEVSSMVDIISFGAPDDRPQASMTTNAPNFGTDWTAGPAPNIHQPQPQGTNSQLLSQITAQPTGFASQYIPPQPTGASFQQQGMQSQSPGFQPQQNNAAPQAFQSNSYQGPRPPMPPIPGAYNSSLSPAQTGQQSPLPLNSQPTGRPGQWGLVNAPSTGLPNIEALQQRMMPQPGREGGFSTAGLSGSATVPWAVTKDEKRIYDQLFKAWDGLNRGFIGGDVAIEVMGQSGLPKADLERIWTLSDPNNKGRLDMDEFAVAMHLIYRKLNGYPVPNQLPPELVPPSTRNFSSSIDTVKSLLSQDAESRKSSGAFLQPQKTGVSYLKNHSFRTSAPAQNALRKDATIFRHNDDDVGYKSSARRRFGAEGRTPSPAQSASPVSERNVDEASVDQLQKQIREKQILLDAMDFADENAAEEDDAIDRKDRKEAEELYRRIRRLQDDIDRHPKASVNDTDSGAERRNLKRQLQRLTDSLPDLASKVRTLERNIADSRLELFRLQDAREHPNSASNIVGTGPGGSVTEADRLKARAKAMMQQRSAALTGKASATGSSNAVADARRLEEESSKAKSERENNERMIKDVEESVGDFSRTLEDTLAQGGESSSSEHERRRWQEGLGVEDEVRDFIFDLQRNSRATRTRNQERRRDHESAGERIQTPNASRNTTPKGQSRQADLPGSSKKSSAPGGSYSSYQTAEDRAAFIKQQAEQRMAERLAALGLKPPPKPNQSSQQRPERETQGRSDRLRQAEEEDLKREDERERRLADERPSAPEIKQTSKKPPPAPPVRKSRADSGPHRAESREKVSLPDANEAEQAGMEKAIKDQQGIQASETKQLENEASRQEAELQKEREASQARLKALEEQVRQGKIKKQEEKRKKQAAEQEGREREAKLSAQRAELEAARERERQLQMQLEGLGDDGSSDEEGPEVVTPQARTPPAGKLGSLDQEQPSPASKPQLDSRGSDMTPSSTTHQQDTSDSTATVSDGSQRASFGVESKNPYYKMMNQATEQTAGQPAATSTPASETNNPFHKITQQQEAARSQPLPPVTSTPTGNRPSRVRPEEDEWSVVDSNSSSDGEEDSEKPTGGSAKQLASMLFGTMAPPRPLSAMDERGSAEGPASPSLPLASPTGAASPGSMPGAFTPEVEVPPAAPVAPPLPPSGAPAAAPAAPAPPPPPPPPPPPGPAGVPAAPPPPPPPAGASAGPAAGLPDRSGLLGAIQKGTGLKKVQTKDRSAASSAGKVLD